MDYASNLRRFGQDDLNDLIRFRFNYIYNFSVQFFERIAKECTVLEAFMGAQAWINDPVNQATAIW